MSSPSASVRIFSVTLCCILCLFFGPVSSFAETYQTGFEPPEFAQGPINETGQAGWRLLEGESASIQSETIYTGQQALEVGAGSVVDKDLSGEISVPFVWIDAWTKVVPLDPLPNVSELATGSTLIHFSDERGITCLDGDGQGGGAWVSTGVFPEPASWVRITIRQNYETQTWACYINESLVNENLGFKDNLPYISGFRGAGSLEGSAFLDDFRVSTLPPDFIFREKPSLSLLEFSTVWGMNETPFNETFFRYDFTEDFSVDASDLLLLIPALRSEVE